MTCIVGVAHKGRVLIGGDSAGVGGWDMTVRKDRKVFVNDGFIMGFTTSFRMGQLLAYSLKPPHPDRNTDLMRFMTVDFVNAVRECLKSGGWATKTNENESGGVFLVGYRGRLFRIDCDYHVEESIYEFNAVGCGANFALGSLHATATADPRKRIEQALRIAERCSAGVRGPFHIVEA